MNIINLHVYPSSFKHESRILKETKSLIDSRLVDKIFIGAIWEKGTQEHEEIDSGREVWRVPLKTSILPNGTLAKSLKQIEWILRIFFRFRKEHINIVQCHNISSLLIGMLFKIFAKSKVVYDAHELETEKPGMTGIRKKISKITERLLLRYVDTVIVVSESIAEWYKGEYPSKTIYTIKNVPYAKKDKSGKSNIFREKFNLQDDEILYIYQGVLSAGRGIDILLNIFSEIDKKKHIVFMGYGLFENRIKEYESDFSNVHFQSAVGFHEVISYTKSADVGICLLTNTCLSYFLALPNKLFEYVTSGLPVIVNDFPEMGSFVDKYECGWKVAINELSSITDLIEGMSKEDIKKKGENALKCKNRFGWHKEEEVLLEIYRELKD